MKIPSIDAYKDSIFNEPVKPVSGEKTNGVEKVSDQNTRKQSGTAKLKTNGNLITDKEREFFIKMFPENQHQLEKHEVFTSSGRLQTQTYSKGIIIDGRV